jgi:hypothetical protein
LGVYSTLKIKQTRLTAAKQAVNVNNIMMWASPTRHPGSARMMVALRPRHGGKAAMIIK